MTWFWLNMPLAAVIFALIVGVPLWMVIKHPDTGTDYAAQAPEARPLAPAVPRQRVGAEDRHPVGASSSR
jgi:hypothetical protein